MTRRSGRVSVPAALVVVAAAGLVHAALDMGTSGVAETRKKAPAGELRTPAKPSLAATGRLPTAVQDMQDLIMTAVRSGDIADLRAAIEWNEIRPDVADAPVADVIAHWRQTSADGAGREILAALANVLALPFAVLPLGKDIENNRIYVWPAIADKPLGTLTLAEQVDLLRLMPPAEAVAMLEKGRYTGWRLAIGADGTWHSFKRGK